MANLFQTRNLITLAVLSVLTTGIVVAGFTTGAQAQQDGAAIGEQQNAPSGAVVAATYDAQLAFMQHPGARELEQYLQQAQQQAQQDPQQAAQLQQQVQQKQQQLVAQFHSDLEKAAKQVAREQDIQIVAAGVIYTGDDIQVKDITDALVSEFPQAQQNQQPALPPQQQQQPQGGLNLQD